MNAYPNALIPVLRAACSGKKKRKYYKPPLLPPDDVIQLVLDVSYHASFESEEGRRPGFRLVLCSPGEAEKIIRQPSTNYYYSHTFRLIRLDKERPFNVAELNRLAPAAELKRLLICVGPTASGDPNRELCIWALLDVGENWWKFIHHETEGGMPPPNFLTVSSTGPGELSISAEGEVLASLKGGRVTLPSQDALWAGPLSEFFDGAKGRLHADALQQLGTDKWDSDDDDEDYPQRFYTFFLERLLFHARQRRHGGTILVVPNHLAKTDTRLTDRISVKYPCTYDGAWDLLVRSLVNYRRFYDLHFPLWDARMPCTKDSFRQHSALGREREQIDEGLSDIAQVVASLTSVDGAVVINQRFDVLGFGAEVIASSPSLLHVSAIASGGHRSLVSVESFGTRHRAAFRFCSSLDDSVAFVLSQDGGVKAVKRHGKDVLLWPNINAGAMGI